MVKWVDMEPFQTYNLEWQTGEGCVSLLQRPPQGSTPREAWPPLECDGQQILHDSQWRVAFA